MGKLIITVSPGGRAANVASQPDMSDPTIQAQAAEDAYNAGASIVHIRGNRAPGASGLNEPDMDHWRAITDRIHARTDLIVNFGVAAMSPEVRARLLTLHPDAGSFLVGHHFTGMMVPPVDQQALARIHMEAGVLPELEIFRACDVWNMNQLIKAGLLKPPYCGTLFFNWEGINWSPATPLELDARLAVLPPEMHWTATARGPEHLKIMAHAIMRGGHVRTGLEDNVEFAGGRVPESNAQLVEWLVRLARDLGREVASPQEAREMLGLPRSPETPLA